MNILLIEDEVRVADFIQRGLRAEGLSVNTVGSGEEALALLDQTAFDIIVLDLMLPGIGGQDVCRRLRTQGNRTPILMLTALDAVDERVAGLRLGADDYLGKPFDFDELLARLQALARRAMVGAEPAPDLHMIGSGSLRFNVHTLEGVVDGTVIEMTAREREIFKLLITNPDRTVSRARIANAVWGAGADLMTNIVDVYVSRLRKKLGPSGDRIRTVRGVGYRLVPADFPASSATAATPDLPAAPDASTQG